MISSRHRALNILFEIFENNKFSNITLNKLKQTIFLSKSDINFIFVLVYGVIQYKIYLEYIINKIINPTKTNRKTQILLWMGLYQMKFLNTPTYSIVNEAVEIAKKINISPSFVNAVLRKLTNKNLWVVNIKNKKNIFCLENGFPYWLYKQLEDDYGIENAKKIVIFSNEKPLISFRININKISIEEFLNQFTSKLEIKRSTIAKNAFLTNDKIFTSEAFLNDLIYIQDETSILAVEILNPKPNHSVLDMCAAPGGKLTYIAQLVGQDTKIIGNEINHSKKAIIEKNILNSGCKNIEMQYFDARDIKDKFDYILIDAPCSGFGVIRKKPEIKLRKRTKEEMNQLYKMQEELLNNAYNLLNESGVILYSTCTMNKKENQDQIIQFLKSYKKMKLEYEKQFFNFEANYNGFYIAKMKKY